MPHGFPDRHLDVPYQRFVTVRYPEMLQGIDDWDYAITLPNKWALSEIQKGNWPPPNTLYEVKVEDTTICTVVMNPKSVLLIGPKMPKKFEPEFLEFRQYVLFWSLLLFSFQHLRIHGRF